MSDDCLTCRVEGCDRDVKYGGKQLCGLHYSRLRRTGSTAAPQVKPELTRFTERVTATPDSDCWIWTGATNRSGGTGYGTFSKINRRSVYAHRWSYEYHRGEIPEGLQIDHLCRNTLCVNPWHLEPVTPRVNGLRSEGPCAHKARQTECSWGHPLDDVNTYFRPGLRGGRDCRACRRRRDAERRPRKRNQEDSK